MQNIEAAVIFNCTTSDLDEHEDEVPSCVLLFESSERRMGRVENFRCTFISHHITYAIYDI